MSDSEPIDMAAETIAEAGARVSIRMFNRIRGERDAALAEVERLKTRLDIAGVHQAATESDWTIDICNHINIADALKRAEKAEVARLTAVVQGVREIAERECDCAGHHTCDSEEILSILAGGEKP